MSSVQLPTTPPSVPVLAAEALYRQLFEKNRAVQLLIDPTSGRILDANPAACTFYGYKHEELTRMRITEINTLSEEEVIQEMQRAVQKKRLFFCFRHRLASGAERDAEIYTSPIQTQDGVVLHSIIHDVTSRVEAEQQPWRGKPNGSRSGQGFTAPFSASARSRRWTRRTPRPCSAFSRSHSPM